MLRRSSGCFVGHDVGVRVILFCTIVLCVDAFCVLDVFWCTLDAPTRNALVHALNKKQYLWIFYIISLISEPSMIDCSSGQES